MRLLRRVLPNSLSCTTMIDLKKFPTTEDELKELGEGIHSFPGTFEEYVDLLIRTDLRVEFADDQLIFMSYATYTHEQLVIRIVTLLAQLHLEETREIDALGSSHRVYVAGQKKSFAPDTFFVKGIPDTIQPKQQVFMVKSPWLIIEILSPKTRQYDLGTKLPAYKTIPSAQFILYIEQREPSVTLHHRESDGLWRSRDYGPESPAIEIDGVSFTVAQLYRGVRSEK